MSGVLLLDTDWLYRKGATAFYNAMDISLNGINRICNKYIAINVSSAAGWFAGNGLAILIRSLILPLKALFGSKKEMLETVQNKADSAIETSSTPIGMSVAATALFIILLFFLS